MQKYFINQYIGYESLDPSLLFPVIINQGCFCEGEEYYLGLKSTGLGRGKSVEWRSCICIIVNCVFRKIWTVCWYKVIYFRVFVIKINHLWTDGYCAREKYKLSCMWRLLFRTLTLRKYIISTGSILICVLISVCTVSHLISWTLREFWISR